MADAASRKHLRLDLTDERLWDGDQVIPLTPTSYALLRYFVLHPQRLLTKDEILEEVWPETYVTQGLVKDYVQDIRRALGDDPKQPRFIETVRGRGYRFVGEIEVASARREDLPTTSGAVAATSRPDQPAVASASSAAKRVGRTLWTWALAAAVAVVLAGAGVVVVWLRPWEPTMEPASIERMAYPQRDRPSIAVLPFVNLSDDPNLVYFSDGVTEDIITELARSPDLLVASRTSSFTYKGEPVKVQQVAQELRVQYVLEGSVRKEAKKVRITAQLVDGRTGHHVWAERIDEEGNNIFELQDDVTRSIISTLGGGEGKIRQAAAARAWEKDPARLEEYDYYLRGHAIYYRFTRKDMARAREIWLEGLKKFPNSGLLRIKVGWSLFQDARHRWSARPKEDLALAFKLAREGLADENLPPVGQWYGHWLMSIVYLWHSRDFERALAEAELTLTLAPNDSETIVFSSQIPLFSGDPELALTWINRGITLERQVPTWFYRYLAWASFLQGEYHTAVEQLQRISWPDLERLQLLAASYSRLGLIEDARAAVADLRILHPDISIASLRELLPYRDQTVLEDLLADLKKAGVPE